LRSGPQLSRPYKVYVHADGHVSDSVSQAWRYTGLAVASQAARQAVTRARGVELTAALGPCPRNLDFPGMLPAAAHVSVAAVATDLTDLSQHVTYSDRPSARPAPRPRASVLQPPPRSPARPVLGRR
jgi:hypothetical protein